MAYTEKILAEFDKKFPSHGYNDNAENEFHSQNIKRFLIESIHQALAEDRERVRDWAKSKKEKLTMKWDEDKAKSTVYDSIIFSWDDFPSQDKPLTDK